MVNSALDISSIENPDCGQRLRKRLKVEKLTSKAIVDKFDHNDYDDNDPENSFEEELTKRKEKIEAEKTRNI